MITIIYIPYTYRIFHIPTKKYYYGSKTSNYKNNIANPNLFFIKYFTSSKKVKELIKYYGKDSFEIQRIKIHKSKEDALNWEMKFLLKINAANRSNWINESNGGKHFFNKGHSTQTREKLKKNHKGMLGKKHKKESIEKYKNTLKEIGHPMQGKHHSDESKKKIGEYWKNRKRGPLSEEHKEKLRQAKLGTKQSEEHKEKLRQAKLGKKYKLKNDLYYL